MPIYANADAEFPNIPCRSFQMASSYNVFYKAFN